MIVTATNGSGSGTATSRPSLAVTEGAPADIGAPSVLLRPADSRADADGGTGNLGAGPDRSPTPTSGAAARCWANAEDISGATGPTYTVGPLQIASSIEVVVTAHNAHGSSSATSPPTDLIKALLPSNLELPSITGLLQDGGLLSALTGAWSGSEPLSFSYLWELCDSAGLDCKEVSGALGSTLGLLAGAVGSTVRVIVTATNSAGSTTATSEPTSLVKALLPSNTGLPSITGLLQDGSSLTAVLGSWSGTGPLSFSESVGTVRCGRAELQSDRRSRRLDAGVDRRRGRRHRATGRHGHQLRRVDHRHLRTDEPDRLAAARRTRPCLASPACCRTAGCCLL